MTTEKAAKKAKFELTAALAAAIKVDVLEGTALQAIKDKAEAGKNKVSQTAVAMGDKMMKDINTGARVSLTTQALQLSKDNVKKLLKRDLSRIAKKAKKAYNVRVVDESNTSLVFYFEEKKAKKAEVKVEEKKVA